MIDWKRAVTVISVSAALGGLSGYYIQEPLWVVFMTGIMIGLITTGSTITWWLRD